MGTADVRIRCFDDEWVDIGSVRVLLYKLKYESELVPPSVPEIGGLIAAVSGSGDISKVSEVLKGYLDTSRSMPDCDLVLIELNYGGVRFSYVTSRKRVKCVPLSPVPDLVKSIEVLSKSPVTTSVEVDALQRGLLTRTKQQLGSELYAACLVGEASGADTVAIGVELLNYGLRTVMAGELRDTLVREQPARAKRKRKSRRKIKKRLKK